MWLLSYPKLQFVFTWSALTANIHVQCKQIEVLNVSNVPFPSVPWLTNIAAKANASYGKDILECTWCYRYRISSFNDGQASVFYTGIDGGTESFWIIDRVAPKENGVQTAFPHISRNIPGGGLGGRQMPIAHSVLFDLDVSKWHHSCTAYSSVLKEAQWYLDGLKVYQYKYEYEQQEPLPSNAFDVMLFGWNIRGLITDVQVYNSYFEEDDLKNWTTTCTSSKGEIFSWDKTKLNITQVPHIFHFTWV